MSYAEVMASEGTTQTAYAFTGENYDPQTGLVFLRARFYQAGIGRFIQKDHFAGIDLGPQSFNGYFYAMNNPAVYTDANGNCPPCWLALLLGVLLTSCSGGPTPGTTPSPMPIPSLPPLPTPSPFPSPSPIPTPTPTPSSSPTHADIATIPSPGEPAYNGDGAWDKTTKKYKEIRDSFMISQAEVLGFSFDPDNYGPRFKDDVLLAFIITGEFGMYRGDTIYTHCLKALHNQYQSQDLCGGKCDSVKKQLTWLSTKQMMRTYDAQFFINHFRTHLDYGRRVEQGEFGGSDNWEWGNYTKGSDFGKYVSGEKKEPAYGYVDINTDHFDPRENKDYAGFGVFTYAQDQACGNCLG